MLRAQREIDIEGDCGDNDRSRIVDARVVGATFVEIVARGAAVAAERERCKCYGRC